MTLRLGRSTLFSDLDVDAEPNAPLGPLTWYGIGGRADMLIRPHTVDALATLIKRCYRSRTPLRVLGSGANLLVADEGVDGVVVRLDQPAFRETTFAGADSAQLNVMAGADMARTLMESARRGLDGLSQMAGIPASIGGAIRMNAGGAYGSISDSITHVTCIQRSGKVVTYPASELRFEYRRTNIPDPLILSAQFSMEPGDPIAIRDRIKDIFTFKKSTQPLAESSAGCTFKNPFDPETEQRVPAGRLIDEAGLKGYAIGGASVSPHHANFIVTRPGTTTADVMALLTHIRRCVFDRSGLELQTEVVIWSRDPDVDTEVGHHESKKETT